MNTQPHEAVDYSGEPQGTIGPLFPIKCFVRREIILTLGSTHSFVRFLPSYHHIVSCSFEITFSSYTTCLCDVKLFLRGTAASVG